MRPAGLLPGLPLYRAKNVCTTWGDYFFMEALATRLHGVPTFW